MVPTMESPPGEPLTCQLTSWLLEFETVAENSCVDPSGTRAVVGVISTTTAEDEPPPPPPPPPPLQATSSEAAAHATKWRGESEIIEVSATRGSPVDGTKTRPDSFRNAEVRWMSGGNLPNMSEGVVDHRHTRTCAICRICFVASHAWQAEKV